MKLEYKDLLNVSLKEADCVRDETVYYIEKVV